VSLLSYVGYKLISVDYADVVCSVLLVQLVLENFGIENGNVNQLAKVLCTYIVVVIVLITIFSVIIIISLVCRVFRIAYLKKNNGSEVYTVKAIL
jgi:hypothetical protein